MQKKDNLFVTHIITTLDSGGAEAMLHKLVRCFAAKGQMRQQVISLKDKGKYGPKIEDAGVPVHCLNMKTNLFEIGDFKKIFAILRKDKPDIIQTWLYHSDFFGLVFAKILKIPVLWNIRCSDMDFSPYPFTTKLIFKILRKLSSFPDVIVANSVSGKNSHTLKGYNPKKWEIIPNGFDTDIYRPDPGAKARLCRSLEISEENPIVGMIARYDPMKDHRTFFSAVKILNKRMPKVKFVCVGRGMTRENPVINEMIGKNTIENCVFLPGQKDNPEKIIPGFDLVTLTSAFGEGFPNVIGEAMSCGVPCVSTCVGDVSAIMGQTGEIVEPESPMLLADAWEKILSMPRKKRKALGLKARKRIIDNFSMDAIAKKYEKLYREVAGYTKLTRADGAG